MKNENGIEKSAILSGNTLVNICKPFEFDIQTTDSGLRHLKDNINMLNIPLDDNKNYSVWVEIDINEIGAFSLSYTGGVGTLVFDSIIDLTLTGGSVVVYPCVKRKDSLNTDFSIGAMQGSTEGRLKGRIMVFEGDVRGLELSYFEGMQSVKMPVLKTTGKNLFDVKLEYGIINGDNGLPYNSNDFVRTQDFIPINCEKIAYTVINEQCGLSFYFYDKDKKFISSVVIINVNGNLSIPEGVAYLKFRTNPLSNESVTTNLNDSN